MGDRIMTVPTLFLSIALILLAMAGLGLLTINAVLQRDFPLIQGIAIVTSAIFVVINIIVDLVATTMDPRLEY